MTPTTSPAAPAADAALAASGGADAAAPAISLAALARGAEAVVAVVDGDDELGRRLCAVGFWPGVRVRCLHRAFGGDPLLFRLHGYRLALRRAEADRVRVVEPRG